MMIWTAINKLTNLAVATELTSINLLASWGFMWLAEWCECMTREWRTPCDRANVCMLSENAHCVCQLKDFSFTINEGGFWVCFSFFFFYLVVKTKEKLFLLIYFTNLFIVFRSCPCTYLTFKTMPTETKIRNNERRNAGWQSWSQNKFFAQP